MPPRIVLRLACVVLLFTTAAVRADDWPQWMGPGRDGNWNETGIFEAFPAGGPAVKWRAPVGGGYAGPAVAGGRVFVMDYLRAEGDATANPGRRSKLKGSERVLCLDAATGKQLWKHEYDCPYEVSYAAGPRCTPTVSGEHVYTLGTEGNLFCLEAATGKVVWSHDLKKDYRTKTPMWGFCGHPLVDGDKLICLVGGEGSVAVAFDRHTGKEIWRALTAREPGYCPPSIIEAGGKRQLLIWHAESINALDPETGKPYWSVPLEPAYDMSIMIPQKSGDYLFASGIGEKAALLKLAADKPGAEVVWEGKASNAVYCANSTPRIEDGYIYGCCCMQGQFRCVKLESGERVWESFAPTTGGKRAGHGTAFIVKNGSRYFLFSETGDLIIAKLTPKAYEEIGRTHLLEPTGDAFGRPVVWSHPAFAEKCVFARNDKEIVCVSLAAR